MSSSAPKSMKLHFKGDKPEKKRKKRSHSSGHGEGKSKSRSGREDGESDVEDVGGDEQAWVPVEHATDLSGPTLFYQPAASSSSAPPRAHILSLNTTMSRLDLVPHTLQPPSSASLSAIDAEELEGAQIVDDASSSSPSTQLSHHLSPQDVNQVFVASRVLDTFNPPRYTFRTIENRYIGSDKFGSTHCSSEAKGPQEEWSLHAVPGGVLIQSATHGGCLTLDEVAGGKKVLRVDQREEEGRIDDAMVWSLKVQWKFRHEARKNERAREVGKGGLAGMDKRLKMQDNSTASLSSYKDQGIKMDKALKRAAREGRMAEEMLDRRSKAKGDKYC